MNRLCVALAAVSLGAAAASAGAEWLYSVDLGTVSLCRVDPATGGVEVVGPLTGFNGTILDLEFVGEHLYALANVSPQKRLLELDVATGAILSSVLVTEDGETSIANAAEGLGSDAAGNLLISFWFPGSSTTLSNQIGILGLDGVISLPRLIGRDMDGLTRRFDGGLFGIDRDPATSTNTIFFVSHDPPGAGGIHTMSFDAVADGLDDLAQTRTGLYGLDYVTRRAIRFDSNTGVVVSSVPYTAGFTFVQVATPPPCRGDADGDGDRDFADITAVLTAFSAPTSPYGPGDADGDGDVDFADITAVLEGFAAPCFPS